MELAADAEQAASFRAALVRERAQLRSTVVERQALIDRGLATSAALSKTRNAQVDLQHIERMIDRLDRRFGAYWTSHGMLPTE